MYFVMLTQPSRELFQSMNSVVRSLNEKFQELPVDSDHKRKSIVSYTDQIRSAADLSQGPEQEAPPIKLRTALDRLHRPTPLRDAFVKQEAEAGSSAPPAPCLSAREQLQQLQSAARAAQARAELAARHADVMEKEVLPLLQQVSEILIKNQIPSQQFCNDLQIFFERIKYK